MKKILLRFSIVFCWTALILTILYIPTDTLPIYQRSINILTWGDILAPSIIQEFENRSGIRINLSYFSSNEELLVKMKSLEGEGYDLIVPSDYCVEILAKEGLLKQLSTDKLSFYPQLNPMLLNHSFDPSNQYSIPFTWELFVLGINRDYFKSHPLDPSWKMLFDPSVVQYPIVMINDPIQAFLIASFYLYGPIEKASRYELANTIRLLIEQKKWVTAYADFRADYFLASHRCPVVLSSTSYITRAMRRFDYIDFVVPKEGSFFSIENFCIPAKSSKEHLVYQLLEFLYTPESMKEHFHLYGIFPSTLDVLPLLDLNDKTKKLLASSPENFKKFHSTQVIASQEEIRDGWIQVKSTVFH